MSNIHPTMAAFLAPFVPASRNAERTDSAPGYMAGYSSRTDYELSWRERQDQLDAETKAAFLQSCRAADANALATWAPTVSDWTSDEPHARRVPLFHEVLAESLDFSTGPTLSEVMQLVLNVAHGANLVNAPAQARALLERMGTEWVRHCGPEA